MTNEDIIEQLLAQNARLLEMLNKALSVNVPQQTQQEIIERTEITSPMALSSRRWDQKKQKLEYIFGHEITRHTSSTIAENDVESAASQRTVFGDESDTETRQQNASSIT